DELAEPLGVWLNQASLAERPGLITALPRLLQRMSDRQQIVALLERLLTPFTEQPETRTASRIAIARAQFNAGQTEAALAAVRAAQAGEPAAVAPVLLALEMLPGSAAAEQVVTAHLARAEVDPSIRLGYVRVLTQSQRYADAIVQLERLTRERPQLAQPWLTLGALQIELKRPRDGEAALQRYIELASKPAPTEPDADSDEDDAPGRTGLTQAWLLLAQAAEQRGDLKGAEAWLGKIDGSQRALEVQTRRAMLLARQGQLAKARALIQQVPEQSPDDARAKLLAETQLLREVKRWREAIEVLTQANQRFADDTELLYEQAMIEEKLDHIPAMERLLRRVIALKPDHGHAHNALGYSLADRNDRLPEARDLIRRALELAPGDPFITDSLGWVEFRLGNATEATRLLREAYRARPDTEIAAHLGEVLWASGQRDEARRIWAEARGRDATNEVLRATLARLKVGL
ncbi:MAG: tetratricopeptide repeat protein, partial [Burkholderiales bacterium]|nr:tetratricopeptide repeat protein [Burkholderiales bacterium]